MIQELSLYKIYELFQEGKTFSLVDLRLPEEFLYKKVNYCEITRPLMVGGYLFKFEGSPDIVRIGGTGNVSYPQKIYQTLLIELEGDAE
jgi:hypothetical protein